MYRVPSLSEKGWTSDSLSTLSYVFSCYLLTDGAQSLLYEDSIVSLPVTYYKYINDPEGMASAVSSDMTKLLTKYFTHVEVSARAKQITGSHYAVLVGASVYDEAGENFQLSRIMEIDNSDLRKIVNVNNYGDATAAF